MRCGTQPETRITAEDVHAVQENRHAPARTLLTTGGLAQGCPTGSVIIVASFSAGGPIDMVTRLIPEPVSAVLDQQIGVQNASGAGGTLAVPGRQHRT